MSAIRNTRLRGIAKERNFRARNPTPKFVPNSRSSTILNGKKILL
jgi:hypothetical protein